MTVERWIRVIAGTFILLSLALGVEGSPLVRQPVGAGLHGLCRRQLAAVRLHQLLPAWASSCASWACATAWPAPPDAGASRHPAAWRHNMGVPMHISALTMAPFTDESARADLLNRLRRAEGQLRGVQRMIEEGEPCLDIAGQMAAVRKALDSAYVRMTVCFMQQELQQRLAPDARRKGELSAGAGRGAEPCWARCAEPCRPSRVSRRILSSSFTIAS